MPVFRTFDETRRNGIVFDVSNDSAEFVGISHPAIEGLVAPERLACATEDAIGLTGGGTFQPASNRGQRDVRRNQQVNVVWHDDPGVKAIKLSVQRASENRRGNKACNPCIRQPLSTSSIAIESSVLSYESPACGQKYVPLGGRYRSMQPPVQKNRNSFRADMRQSSAVFEHEGRRKRLPHSASEARKFSRKI